MVAIKIIRGIKKYRDAALIEIGFSSSLVNMTKVDPGESSGSLVHFS